MNSEKIKEISKQMGVLFDQIRQLEKEAQKESNPLIKKEVGMDGIFYRAIFPEGCEPINMWIISRTVERGQKAGCNKDGGQLAGLFVAVQVLEQIKKDGGDNLVVDAHRKFYEAAIEAIRLNS
jgi:hypothetical protein